MSKVEGKMSRVEGKMSRVEGKMSRVQKCRLHSGFDSLVKKPEFLGRFGIIELFTFLYTIEYFHAVMRRSIRNFNIPPGHTPGI